MDNPQLTNQINQLRSYFAQLQRQPDGSVQIEAQQLDELLHQLDALSQIPQASDQSGHASPSEAGKVNSNGAGIRGGLPAETTVWFDAPLGKSPRDTLDRDDGSQNTFQCVATFEVVFNAQGSPIDMILLDANTNFTQISGHLKEEVVGKPVSQIFGSPDWIEAYQEPLTQALTTAQPRQVETYFAPLDRYFSVMAVPLDENHLLVTALDISEQRQTEKALQQSYEKYRTILESITDAYYALDNEWRFLTINPTAARDLFRDHPVEELLGRVIWDVYPDAVGGEFYQQYHQAVGERQAVHFEARSNITDAWFESHAYPRDGYLEIFLRNITGRKLAEQGQERLLQEARNHEAELEAVFDAMTDLVLVLDAEGVPVQANKATLAFYGYDPVGKPRSNIIERHALRHPDGRPMELSELPTSRALRGETIVDERLIFRNSDGEDLSILATVNPLYTDAGSLAGLVSVWHDVTEHERLVEENTRQSSLLDAIFAADPSGLAVVTGPDLRFAYVNPVFRMICPQFLDDFINEPYEAAWPSPEWDELRGRIARVLQSGQPFQILEVERVFPDGGSRVFTLQARRINWEGESAALLIFWDTTEACQAQSALRASEQHLRNLLNTLYVFVGVLRPDGTLVEANRAPLEAAGIQIEDVFGKPFDETYWWSHSPKAQKRIRQAIDRAARGEVARFDIEARIADGQIITLDFMIAPMRDEQGHIRYLVPSAVDITERRRAEQERERLLDQVETERTRLAAIIANTPVGIAMFDQSGRPVLSNPEALHVYPPTRLLASPAGHTLVQTALQGESQINREIVLNRRDGGPYHLLVNSAPVLNRKGQVDGGVIVYQDISTRKRQEEKVHNQNRIVAGISRIFREALVYDTEAELGQICLEVAEEVTQSKFGFIGEIGPDGCLHDIAISSPGREQCTMFDQTGHRQLQGSLEAHDLYEQVLVEGKSLLTNRPAGHPDSAGLPPGHPPLSAFLGAPLIQEGRTIGILAVGNRKGGYSPTEQEALEALAPAVVEAFARKRAEAALRQSQQELRRLIDTSFEGIWSVDQDGKTTTVNHRAAEILGYTIEEIQGQIAFEFLMPEDVEAGRATLERISRGESGVVEAHARHKAGHALWLLVSFSPVVDGDGKVQGALAVFNDITARKRQELNAAFLVEIGEDLARLTSPDEMMRTVGEKLRDYFSVDRLTFAEIDEAAGLVTRVYPVRGQDLASTYEPQPLSDFASQEWLQEQRTGRVIAVNDIYTDPRFTGHAEAYRKWGIRSQIIAPFVKNGRLAYAIVVQHKEPRAWRADEIELLEDLSARIYPRLTNAWSEKALRENEERFQLASKAAVGVLYDWTINRDQVYQSEGLVKVVGYRPGEEPGGSQDWWPRNIHPEDYPRVQAELQAAMDQMADSVSYEYRIRHADGHWVHVWDQCYIVRDAQGNVQRVVGTATDITEKKQAEEALRQSEARFRVALGNAPISVFSQDRSLRFNWIFNPQLGIHQDEMVGRREDEFHPPEDVAELVALKKAVIESGQGVRREIQLKTPKGWRNLIFNLEPVFANSGDVTGLVGSAMDITGLRQVEEDAIQNRTRVEVQHRLIEQREQERLQIARDLHDGPLQELIGVTFSIEELLSKVKDPHDSETLSLIKGVVFQQIKDLRAYASELRPPMLAKLGLAKAIRAHAKSLRQKQPDLKINLQVENEASTLPENTRLALYRIYQEALKNIVRHAQATEVWIRFTMGAEQAELEIRDNGIGFTLPRHWVDLARKGHLGLVGIQERSEAIGGVFEISSYPGKGTRVQIKVPTDQVVAEE